MKEMKSTMEDAKAPQCKGMSKSHDVVAHVVTHASGVPDGDDDDSGCKDRHAQLFGAMLLTASS